MTADELKQAIRDTLIEYRERLTLLEAENKRLVAENESLRVRYEMALSDVVKGNIREVQLKRELEYWRNRGMGGMA